ncbi:DUF2474 domain-containing protein [Salmonella enterica subsp. enterica]|nr:DUF2474 domain-containing protein [Salmonella enterica subsp. enterica]
MVVRKKWSRRVVWMVAIWCASVLLLAGVGMLFRPLMTRSDFALTDVSDALSSLAKARFIDRRFIDDHLCSPFISPQQRLIIILIFIVVSPQ